MLEVVTVTVVEAPAASVALVVPVLAKTAETTWAEPLRVSTAVRLWVETFLIVNTPVNARAEGTRENASASVSTFCLRRHDRAARKGNGGPFGMNRVGAAPQQELRIRPGTRRSSP